MDERTGHGYAVRRVYLPASREHEPVRVRHARRDILVRCIAGIFVAMLLGETLAIIMLRR